MTSPPIYVYIVECADGSLYTGRANDITRRVHEHNNGKTGAKYTRSRRPVRLVHAEQCANLSDALRREGEIKKLSRAQKLALIENELPRGKPRGIKSEDNTK